MKHHEGFEVKVVKEWTHELGFIVRRVLMRVEGSQGDWTEGLFTYTAGDLSIGDLKTATMLYKLGIAPEYRTETSTICSIGFSEDTQKWYGWSHRSICGFGVGDLEYPYTGHVPECITTLEQAKESAWHFASYVSG